MPLNDKDVLHVARLARLALTPEEKEKYRAQLERILEYVRALEKYDTQGVPPTSHVAALANVWREDEPRPWTDAESILANAPEREDVYFKVRKVIE